jgi:flagellar hook-associated protein 2
MGSPITFSGFNQIDFSVVLNAIMQQESIPLLRLQGQQQALQATSSAYGQLATKLDALRTASSALSSASSFTTFAAQSSDTTALTASASSSAQQGRYDIVVNELAHTQVTVSSSSAPDADSTVVATGGSLTIGSEQIDVAGPVTLTQLAAAINADAGSPATASVLATAPSEYRLVLTSKNTGLANAFTISNQLAGSSVAFTDTDNDNVSGDSAADNAVNATDASVQINNITVTSSSNTLDTAIPGVTLTLLQKDPSKTVVVTVSPDESDLANRLDSFVSAYNALVGFFNAQAAASANGTTGAIGRDSLLRGLHQSLRTALLSPHGSAAYTTLSEIGVGFTRTGELSLDRTALSEAVATNPDAVRTLFADAATGAFKAVNALVDEYTNSSGFLPDAQTRLTDAIARVGGQIDDMQARLAVRKAALQQEFIAADQAMTRLNSQKGSLAAFNTSLLSSTP